jgi:signal transduction histidine kinase
MGGDVWLISGLGEHTTFYVALPAPSTPEKTG